MVQSLIISIIDFVFRKINNVILQVDRDRDWVKLNRDNFLKKQVLVGSIKYAKGEIFIDNKGVIEIGNNFQFNSGAEFNPIGGDVVLRLIAFKKGSKIVIGDNVGISNSTLVCWDKITIEDNVMIGGGVKIWDTNFHSLDPIIRVSDNDTDAKTAPILIKKFAFIGAGSIILKGVTIGENSIIAANSVVIKDIPDNVIAGGNPCKVIRDIY